MAMNYLLDKKYDETFTINFIGTEEFHPGDTLRLTMPECMKNIKTLDGYSDEVSGETASVYLKILFRYKYSTDKDWSDPLPLSDLTLIELCSRKCLLIELLYFRMDDGGPNSGVTITLTNPSINGTYTLTTGDAFIVLTPSDNVQILESGDFLKIFSISDFEVISTPKYGSPLFNIQYRFSQDGQMTWTEWEPLTKANISTVHWDKTRFVELQYLFSGTTESNVKIYEVILYGDFQNVTANSIKLNMYGLKENCVNIAFPPAGITEATSGINEKTPTTNTKAPDSTTTTMINEASEYQLRMNWVTNGLNCFTDSGDVVNLSVTEQLAQENAANSAGFWNPYEFQKATEWQNLLANQIAQMLGMVVEYHLTDPDGNGIDRVIHEQQLFNIVDMKTIKVLVPDNQFPENQIVINQFNLDLFDTFKINILKDEFKKAFGITKRPGQQDIIYFCQINRMFIIKHAQIHRDVMNSGIYYDVVLEKYEKRANVLNRMEESKNRIEELTRNTTIDDLFGFDEKNDMTKIANKIQLKPESFDPIRSVINARTRMIREPIMNGDIKVIESYYDFANVAQTEYAVQYTKADNNVKESDNRSFIFWFNFPNDYSEGKAISKKMIAGYDVSSNKYVMLNNMTGDTLIANSDDSYTNSIGYKVWFQSNKIYYMINNTTHVMDAPIMTDVWYALLINMDQRQRTCDMKLLRRNTVITVLLFQPDTYERLEMEYDDPDLPYEINVNGFKPVDNIETTSTQAQATFVEMGSYSKSNVEPVQFSHNLDFTIFGSKMKLSNIRVMDDLVRPEFQQIVLNELVIKDAQHLILGDNATKKIFTTNYPNKQWR
jgi:hypothetical protein